MSLSPIGAFIPTARLIVTALACAAFPTIAFAQTPEAPPAQPEMRANCPGLVAADRPPATPAAFRLAALNADQVRITFIGHATFLIESPELVRIATDYNDYVRPPLTPDIATMNKAHSTHYSLSPDPGIKLGLRGWRDDGKTGRARPYVGRRAGAQRRHQHPHVGWRRHRAPR